MTAVDRVVLGKAVLWLHWKLPYFSK